MGVIVVIDRPGRACLSPEASFAPICTAQTSALQLQFIVIVDAMADDSDLVFDENGIEARLQNGPEDGAGCGNDGELDFETAKDHGWRCVEGEVHVWFPAGFVSDNGCEAPG